MAIHYVNIEKEEFLKDYKRVFHFTTIDRFIEIVKTSKIAFVNPSAWPDPFEKFFVEREFLIENEKFNLPINGKLFAFCVSGTLNSEAYWKVYAPKEDGIRLTFNTSKLITNFLENIKDAEVYIGKVSYHITKEFHDPTFNKKSLISEIKNKKIGEEQIKLMLKKRKSFFYEDEIRIMIIPHKKNEKSSIIHRTTKIDIYTDNYTLDPRLGKYKATALKEYFKTFFGFKVSKSRLYSDLKRKPINLTD